MRNENMYFACAELVRELSRLIDSGHSLDRDKFHDICDKERFVDHLVTEHGDFVQLEFLDKNSTICKPENLEYINNAFGRHGNAAVMEDFGLKNNAYLLAINFVVQILREIADEQ